MNKVRKFHQSFKKFAENLTISSKTKGGLLTARAAVRTCLREYFADPAGGIPERLATSESYAWKWAFPRGAKPRFLTQGSFAYHTLNRPHTTPPQQVDLDDGAYFVMSELAASKEFRGPSSKTLFHEVEAALGPLVLSKGWKLVTDKPTCVRIIVSAEAHIDIPLYVVSSEEVNKLEIAQANHDAGLVARYKQAGLQYYPSVSKVLLAHRKEGWVSSDPRKVLHWVAECVGKYGKAYRHVCRYLKAWRDNQWEKPPLSSICIMAMAANALDEAGIHAGSGLQDDDIVLAVVERMKRQLLAGVFDPANSGKRLDQDISAHETKDICQRIDVLETALRNALCATNLSIGTAVELLCKEFGRYFPKDSTLAIKIAIAAAGGVTPAVVVSVPRPWASTDSAPPNRQNAIKMSRDSLKFLAHYHQGMCVQDGSTIAGVMTFRAQKTGPGQIEIYHDKIPSAAIEKTYIEDEYELEMWFGLCEFGVIWPHVKETGGRLKRRAVAKGKSIVYCHVSLATEELCLAAPQKTAEIMQEDSSVKNFFERLLIPNLYYHSYCDRFDHEPWPGLAHGFIGILEDVADSKESIQSGRFRWDFFTLHLERNRPGIIRCLQGLGRNLKSHDQCFCGSGKKIKKCGHLKAMKGANVLRKWLMHARPHSPKMLADNFRNFYH